MQIIEQEIITSTVNKEAMSYNSFKALIDEGLAEGKTTGTEQSKALTKYTRLNRQRMKRLDKQIELNKSLKEELKNVNEPWIWLVLVEGWCGDVAQNVPVINKMAETAPKIELRLLLRTECPDVMDQYLTDGSRSIPKLICLHANYLHELGTWGPRPESFQRKVMQWKDDSDISHEEWVEKLQKWYVEDKTQTLQSDFEKLIDEWNDKEVG